MAAILQPHLPQKPHSIYSYASLARPPHLSRLETATHKTGYVEPLSIDVDDAEGGFFPGFLHLPPDFFSSPPLQDPDSGVRLPASSRGTLPLHHHRTAAILLSGAGGGVTGPSSIYLSLACKLATLGRGIPCLRLDYRYPAKAEACVRDVDAAKAYLHDMYGLDRFVLVGWSMGAAVALAAAADDDRVVGCATLASQPLLKEAHIHALPPRPLLVMHGTADNTVVVGQSQHLWHLYGDGDRMLQVFEEDNHSLSRNAEEAEELLCEFTARCAGVPVSSDERRKVVEAELVEPAERHELMERGGDLRAPERED
ncbi:Alpha/Beta hydrolase protein [Staphylotrichum tortipilum]|uniref:Alpha/Beta hydrolase protein n=1 Tax=Staphylotrichum tortipilum TaxID=2831512 RepID=A0AAN6MDU9_9PEZI|nr:Alpha/Beta hydrolase protein [Staphylotrichum longicolle]